MKARIAIFALTVATGLVCAEATAQASHVLGFWQEPTGSVIHVERCGDSICASLVQISKQTPYKIDGQNRDPALRTRPLCNLRIGEGFHATDENRAEGGMLYDPKSGRSYHGSMTAEGNTLKLRGFIGISVFGRTETWTRATAPTTPCSQ